ncbi:MAG TPA: DUF1702 family protein [Actinophytocola sp.]|uniref:DUF1702 family protein n=1 Tax=Actinophytocola sp. TaxID=1872138 RepID=UPI002DBBD0F8|nr:DUF1702 family protein [Actinophytocola sp.]HEU5471195.1 DUF1702 family protein [Actinophytocola sp.]
MATLLGGSRRWALTSSRCGFQWAITAPRLWPVERRISLVAAEFRGFAYEGAAMAFAVRDALTGGHRTRELMLGPGRPHIFLTYTGIGLAMGRLPRMLWRDLVPDLTGSPYYPTMTWLAVDGYGFDRAYRSTRRWVDRQYVPKPYPWQGFPGYFRRAVDQGIGRALWYLHGAAAARVADAVRRFPEHRRGDLWSGVALSAAFAGGSDPEGLALLRKSAGEHRPQLGLGVVFAAKARTVSGFVPPYTGIAAEALAGVSVADAVGIAVATAGVPPETGPLPFYEQWRQRIRDRFTD